MSKVIKIQSNLGSSPSYNADKIEAVFSGDLQQQVQYQVLDEYNLPYGSYITLRNYDDILFDEATKQVTITVGERSLNKTYAILESNEVPDCETMYSLFNQYCPSTSSDCRGIVVISTSEVVYNEIVVEASPISESNNNDYRITNIYLRGEYSTLTNAINETQATNPVVFDFDEIYHKCAKFWKKKVDSVTSTYTKTSGFDTVQDSTIQYLPSFDGGFGQYEYDSGTGEEYNAEYWDQFNNIGSNIHFILPNGKYHLHEYSDSENGVATVDIRVKDSDCNIFDVLFRYIYDYVYTTNELLEAPDPIKVNNPANYTFLLKTYKMYVKEPLNTLEGFASSAANQDIAGLGARKRNGGVAVVLPEGFNVIENLELADSINSYSVKVLTTDEIKELTSEEAQEYFDNTLVHDVTAYKDKLILSESEAKTVLLALNVTACNKYFLISSNVGVKCPSDTQYTYYDLGNFELINNSPTTIFGKSSRTEYKYNTNGKVVRIRQIYDPYSNEYYTISQNNAGDFSEGYPVERKGVCVRCVSGKTDYYYFENTDEGAQIADQFKEDILYAMDEGPSVVVTDQLLSIS